MRDIAQDKERAIRAVQELEASHDPGVKDKASVIAEYIEGLSAEVGDFFDAVGDGLKVTSVAFELNQVVALDRTINLQRGIKVNIVRDEECYAADSKSFSVHGTGDTVGEALTNYMEELVRYFDWLAENEAQLAAPLQKELKNLNRLVSKPS